MENINLCSTPKCGKEAKLRCPDCVKFKIKEGSFFCSKECFKASWQSHKDNHKECNTNLNMFLTNSNQFLI